jgi:DNA-binding protein YbaB
VSADFDRLVTQFERFQARLVDLDEQFAGVGGMQRELAELETSATSPDGAVTVVAGPGGSVRDIRFSDAALRGDARALGTSVMAALRQAVADSARRQAVIVDEHLGGGLNMVDRVLATQAEALGTTVEQLRADMSTEAPPRPEQAEDFAEEHVLRLAGETPHRPAPEPGGSGSAEGGFLKDLFGEEDD